MQAHDKFFKLVFGKARNAADLLRSVLPPALARYLDFEKMADARETSLRTSAVDGQVEQRFKDLLFRIPFTDGDAVLYVLLEHKSRPEDLTTFQSHRYMVDAWSAHLANHKNATELPDILPLVVHHGPGGWTKSTDLRDDFPRLPRDALHAIETYRVRSRFILYDVATESDVELRQRGMNAEATLSLWTLVHAPGNENVTADLPAVHDLLEAVRDELHGHGDLADIVGYILEVSETPREAIHGYLTANLGPKAERAYMTGAEQIRQEERERQEKIRQEERQRQDRRFRDAHRNSLYAVLEARGIPVPELVRARIDSCDDIEQIVIWLRRAAIAESMTAILEDAS